MGSSRPGARAKPGEEGIIEQMTKDWGLAWGVPGQVGQTGPPRGVMGHMRWGGGDPAERQPQSRGWGGAPTPQGSRTTVTGEGSQAAMIPISKSTADNECLASPSRRRGSHKDGKGRNYVSSSII